MVWLGRVESEREAADTPISVFKDALAQMRDSGLAGYLLGFCVAWMADALARTGEPAHAARLFGAAEALLRRAGVSLNPVMQLSPGDGALEVILHRMDHGEMLLLHWSNWCLQHPA